MILDPGVITEQHLAELMDEVRDHRSGANGCRAGACEHGWDNLIETLVAEVRRLRAIVEDARKFAEEWE